MKISTSEIKRVYVLGAAAGLVDHQAHSHEDNLHQLVCAETGKESVSALTQDEFFKVEDRLLQLLKSKPVQKPKKKTAPPESVPGKMTAAQQSIAWRMIYRLCELDPRQSTPGQRMIGAIKKILNMEAAVTAPFAWISFSDGSKLINQLKRYVRSEEQKAARKRAENG